MHTTPQNHFHSFYLRFLFITENLFFFTSQRFLMKYIEQLSSIIITVIIIVMISFVCVWYYCIYIYHTSIIVIFKTMIVDQ